METNRKREIEAEKQKRKEEVIAASIEVFQEKGIENSKMTDIAEKAKVGVASVYRYFKTKPELVIEAAVRFWEEEIGLLYGKYVNESFEKISGLDRVGRILGVFKVLYMEHKDFIRFIEEFDNYIIKEKINPERLENYEKNIVGLKKVIFEAIDYGRRDGSIAQNIDSEIFYITTTHALMSLCQKLVLRGNIIKSDKDVKAEEQIDLVIAMALSFIKNR
ncbi:transcriptional regulator, TetR family [Clostridiales bacterium oral taxon 876 str. F0540]|nr:transcriptional regulator, TetR family [Clostridiales bacterium oral taxon 876 str. F0540]